MKRIAIMGYTDMPNCGEHFLADCLSYLIGPDYQKTFIPFQPKKNRLRYLIFGALIIFSRLFGQSDFAYKLQYIGIYILTKKFYKENLSDCHGLIFACGSYKYTTQKIWAFFSIAIETANELNIPVMINAVNVQKFNALDWRCSLLQKRTNFPCVKMFTTRDGESGIKKIISDYVNPNFHMDIRSVGDVAFWIPETYQNSIHLLPKRRHTIGINLIRGQIFEDYGHHISEEQLIEIYCGFITMLDNMNFKWELFTNGLPSDYVFGEKLLRRLKRSDVEIISCKRAENLIQLTLQYQAILGARLHSCICAYALDIPMIGFIWDEKMLNFSVCTGLQNFFLSEKDLTSESLYQCMLDAMQYKYNNDLRNDLKNKTQKSIADFLLIYVS